MALTPLDEALDQLDPAPQERDPIDVALDRLAAGSEQRMRRAFLQTADRTPEQEAEARRLSFKFGVPPAIISRNLDEYRSREKVDRPYGQMQRETPALSAWVEDPANAAIAKDDMEQLGLLEWVVSAVPRAWRQSLEQMRVSELQTKAAFVGPLTQFEHDELNAAKFLSQHGGELGVGDSWFRGAITGGTKLWANVLAGAQQAGVRGALGAGVGAVIGGTAGFFAGGVGVLPGAAAGAKFGLGVGAFLGGAQFGFTLEAGLAYDEFLDFKPDALGQPLDPAVAKAAAFAAGALNAGLEVVGLGVLARSIPGLDRLKGAAARAAIRNALRNPTIRSAIGGVVREYTGVLTAETSVEVAQRVVTIMSGELGKVVSGQDLPRRTAADIIADLARETAGALQGFTFVALPGPAASLVVNARRVQRAQQAEQFFVALGEGVAQSKTVERMPEAAQAFLEQATKDGPVATLYAPVETFTQYWQDQELDPGQVASELTGDSQAYETALRTGEDLQIPTARYAVKLAGTPHHTFFSQELRLGADEMNAREAKVFQDQIAQQVAALGAPAERPAARVAKNVIQQLERIGVERETAETVATLYEGTLGSFAERAGLAPDALYERYGLTIERPELAAPGIPAETASEAAAAQSPGAPGARPAAQVGLEGLEEIPGLEALQAAVGGATLETVAGDETAALNASGESAASLEALGRQAGMAERGEQFVVYDRGGRRRGLVGPEAVDYQPQRGETYGIEGPTGFRILEDRGGRVTRGAETETGAGRELPGRRPEPGAPPPGGGEPGRRAIEGARGGRPALLPAEERDAFAELLADARERGFTGTDDDLAVRYLEKLAHAREIAGDLAAINEDTGWRGLLTAISKAGGIGLDPETQGLGGYSGEVAWLLESLQARSGIITRGRRAGQFMPRLSAGLKGAPGVIRGKGQGGRSLDSIREVLQADPSGRWAHYADINTLLVDLEDAVIRGHYENQGIAVPGVASPGTRGVLEDFLRVRPGEAWWRDEAAAVDVTFDVEDYGQSLLDDLLELPTGETKVDVLETGEEQPRLPVVGDVREQEVPTPEFQAPFALTPPTAKPRAKQTTLFQPAFHGTPHLFEKFSLHAIGQGEGAQAYGWGLYFSSKREVAAGYRERLAGRPRPKDLRFDEVPIFEKDIGLYYVQPDAAGLPSTKPQDPLIQRGLLELHARMHFVQPGRAGIARMREDLVRSIDNYEKTIAKGQTFSGDAARDAYQLDDYRASLIVLDRYADKLDVTPPTKPGRLFTVEIPDDEQFLDWDKPASQQSERVKTALRTLGVAWTEVAVPTLAEALETFSTPRIQQLAAEDIGIRDTLRGGYYYAKSDDEVAFRNWFYENQGLMTGRGIIDPTGETIYRELQSSRVDLPVTQASSMGVAAMLASKALAAQGVAGIRYLDGFSRAAGAGSHNFVVFDDQLVEVTEFDQPAGPRLSAVHQLSADNLKFAARMGGIAVPSIAVVPEGTGALQGYGDVTLIGTSALGDPARQPIFDADIYSATFPKAEYRKATTKIAQALVDRFRAVAERFEGDRTVIDQLWDNAVNRPNPEDSVNRLRRSPAAMALFLEEQGVSVEPILRDAHMEAPFVAQPAFQRFLEETGGVARLVAHDPADTEYRRGLAAAINVALDEYLATLPDVEADLRADLAQTYRENYIDEADGLPFFGRTLRLERSLKAIGRQDVSVTETREALQLALRGREPAFQTWIDEQIFALHPAPELTVGRRKVPYTLANIVEKMTEARSLKAVEKTLTFGEGAARAFAATQFKDLETMRAVAGQIRPEAEINAARERAKTLMSAWRDAVLPHYTGTDYRGNLDVWNALDASMRAIARWAKTGHTTANLRKALLRQGFVNVPTDVLTQGVEAGRAFLEAPVPYFESKPQRAVGLNEFAGAVIPTTADDETRAILAQAGVAVREYDATDPAARDLTLNTLRSDLAAEGRDVLFQGERRGSIKFGPDRQMTITLLERADLSTILHESGHLFLEIFGDLNDRLGDDATLTPQQRQLRADYRSLLDWLGVPDRDSITPEHHEQFARGVEAYLFEGRAPSLELRSAFARFRAWLISVYRTLRALNVQLTDDVRRVLDRMVATDRAIAEAAAAGQVDPLFTTAESAGMSPAEFGLYRAKLTEASLTAREVLERKVLAEVQREQTAVWKQTRAAIDAEVTAEIQQQPIYRALAAMQRGTNPDGSPLVEGVLEAAPLKLSRRLLVERYGDERLKRLPRPYIYAVEGGLDPDTVAEGYGFASGDALLTALEQTPPASVAIEQETNRRMLERHGSLLLDGSLQAKAQAALSNEDRDLVIRAELRALGQLRRTVAPFIAAEREVLAGERRERTYERRWMEAEAKLRIAIAEGRQQVEIDRLQGEVQNLRQKARGGPATIRAAIPPAGLLREAARARVARTKVRTLKPELFWSAARRAAEQALEAAARQDFNAAIVAKQQELLHLALYREASRAKEDVELRVRRAKDLGRPATRAQLGLAGEAYLDQVDGVLDRYEFAKVSQTVLDRRASLRKFAAALEGEGLPVDLPEELLEETRRVNYQELTIEELIGVTDGLQQIVHLARLKNRLLRKAEQRELDQLASDLATSIRDHARRKVRVPARDRRPSEERRRTVSDFFAGHRKLASMIRELDGFEDGGPAWEAIVRPLNEAGSREAELNADATRRFAELIERAFPGKQKRRLYTKLHVPAIGQSLSRMERLMIALNWGNDGNRDRVRRAERWDDVQVQAVLDTLTPADLTFVQGVFDFLDSYWPAIKAKQERVAGVAPEKVEPTPITTASGTIAGGYFPLKYDDRLSARAIAALDLEAANLARQAAYTQATTRRGHTKERVARVKLPVRRDFGVMFEHVAQVIHDLSHHETLIDIGRILGHADVQQAILETQSDLVYKQIRGSIRDVAFGDVPAIGGLERAINHVRMGATIAGLGWNLGVAFLQPIGLSNSMVRIGPKWVAIGLVRWLRNPSTMVETVHWITEKSAFMRARARTQQREINEIRNQVGVETGRFTGWVNEALKKTTFDTVTKQGITDSYFWLIQQMQRIADVPTWLGAYEKAMAGGETEDRAVALADQAVLDSQGGGQIKDLSEVQRGGPMKRLWTNFYSYFNVVYNQAVESRRRTRFRNPVEVGRLAADYFMLFIVPATLGLFLREALRPRKDDDEEEFAKRLIAENLSYIAGTMMGLREISGTIQGFYGYEGPAGARAFAAFARLVKQVQQKELDEAFWRALNQTAGVILHYPSSQVERTAGGIAAIAEGRTENPRALVAGPPRER